MRASLALLVGSLAIAGCRCGDDAPAPDVADVPGASADGEPGRAATEAGAPDGAGGATVGDRSAAGAAGKLTGSRSAPPATASRDEVPGGPIPVAPFPPGTDEAAFLTAAGARPAWTAARDRAGLLARHGQRGAAWGLGRRDASGQLWLVDPTETAATLGIRLAGAGGRALDAGAGRIVAWGAWGVDDQRRWTWQVERMVALPPAAGQPAPPEPLPSPPLPGHLVADGPRPADAVPPSQLQKSGQVVFVVVAPPAKPGDGWTIADEVKAQPTALLVLPGEAAIYGGLDYLSPDERWPLVPGAWYAAAAAPSKSSRASKPSAAPSKPPRPSGKPPAPGDLPVLRAVAPPDRVPPPAPSASRKPGKPGATVRDR